MEYFTKGSINHEKIWAEFRFDEILPTEFTRKVLHCTALIPFGSKMTYGEIGKAINSKGYRAIGSVLARNPFPLLIPCQRVVGQKSLGGFMGKTASDSSELSLKSALLRFERLQI
jgi:methylated-DNA-[protein]-cysteine S-methyltransferase